MQLNIKGKEQELKFGIGFIRKLDKRFKAEQNGIEFGMGLYMAFPQLDLRNPAILSDIILCAVKGANQQQVDEAIEDYADENDGLEQLFDDVIEGLEQSPVTKATVLEMQDKTENVEN